MKHYFLAAIYFFTSKVVFNWSKTLLVRTCSTKWQKRSELFRTYFLSPIPPLSRSCPNFTSWVPSWLSPPLPTSYFCRGGQMTPHDYGGNVERLGHFSKEIRLRPWACFHRKNGPKTSSWASCCLLLWTYMLVETFLSQKGTQFSHKNYVRSKGAPTPWRGKRGICSTFFISLGEEDWGKTGVTVVVPLR